MKGQYTVINEVLLFGIGAVIAFSVAGTVSFSVESIQNYAQRDQYHYTANLVSLAVSKVYLCGKVGDCELVVNIPRKLANDRYFISLSNDKITLSNLKTDEEFSIDTMNLNKILKGTATSSARYFILSSQGNTITLFK